MFHKSACVLQGLARPGLARSGRPVFYKMLSEKVSRTAIRAHVTCLTVLCGSCPQFQDMAMKQNVAERLQGLLDEPTFSIWLNGDVTGQPAGSLEFGGSDPSLYTGSLYPLPVVSTKCATVSHVIAISVTGGRVPICSRRGFWAASCCQRIPT